MNHYFVDGLFKANNWQMRISRIAGLRYVRIPDLDPGRVIVLLDTGQEVSVDCPAHDVMAEWKRYNNRYKEQAK